MIRARFDVRGNAMARDAGIYLTNRLQLSMRVIIAATNRSEDVVIHHL